MIRVTKRYFGGRGLFVATSQTAVSKKKIKKTVAQKTSKKKIEDSPLKQMIKADADIMLLFWACRKFNLREKAVELLRKRIQN
jgi:hypothetical protein